MPEEAGGGQALAGPAAILQAGLCIGCGSCVAQAATRNVNMALDRLGDLKPTGPSAWLHRRSETFSRTCPFSPSASNESELADALFAGAAHADGRIGRFEAAYVGHAAEGDFRSRGSSGGLTGWVANELLSTGLVDAVAHVGPGDGDRFFNYRLSRTPAELAAAAKSRYYPVEMSEVLQTIRNEPGRYAVVGVPCFVKAVQLLRRQDPVMRERIVFTLGLFCGHMKSTRLVESFATQMEVPLSRVTGLDFRLKDPGRPANWYTAQFRLQDGTSIQRDWFHLAEGDWGAGFFQNAACNFCDDVVAETADVSFGDAWVEPYSSDGNGTNVVIVRNAAVHSLVARALQAGRLSLQSVDADFVARTQAAGLRQRREGLGYRLTWQRWRAGTLRPVKRVKPGANIPVRRKAIYRLRSAVTFLSPRVFAVARRLRAPRLYLSLARWSARLYHAVAYPRR